MCGLVGVITNEKLDISIIKQMTDSIAHRGPDDSGYIVNVFEKFSIGLGHRRLAIIDLDKRSAQPFFNRSNEIAIVYNGEVYNFNELKSKLEDYNFRTDSDTEVILALYETLGIDFVEQLNGIFSFAIIDYRLNKTYLVRDRHGVKPLYYFLDENNFVFASELRPIMKYPYFIKKINPVSLELMLSMRYIPSNLTIFREVYKVEAGTILVFNGISLTEKRIYWDTIDEYYKVLKTNPGIDYYKNILHDAVERNLVSDVEVVSFLSGGIDSSLVSAIAIKYLKRLNTYTIGFDSLQYDESLYAIEVAKQIGLENSVTIAQIDDLVHIALKIAKIYDEPFADSSQLPTYYLSRIVNEDNKKVVLSGDGGDEFFYGYSHYQKIFYRHRLFQFVSPFVKFVLPFTKKNDIGLFHHICSLLGDIRLFYYGLNTGYAGYYSRKTLKEKTDYKEIKVIFNFLNKIKSLSPIVINTLFDQKIYMVDDILVKLDRASMSNSLESRVPLLDHELSKASFKSSFRFHHKKNKHKIILKTVLGDYISESLIDRRKQGFSINLIDLINHNLIKEKMEKYLSIEFLIEQGFFKPKEISDLYKNYLDHPKPRLASFLWSFFVFQSWYEEYM